MSRDPYPVEYLVKRFFDISLSIMAFVCLACAIAIGIYSDNPDKNLILGLGMVASILGVFLEFRQKATYDNDPIEVIILDDALQAKYLNSVAKLRHKLVAANILIIVIGILVSGYGVIWHAL